MPCSRAVLLPLLLLALVPPARADNWPQWRGPRSDGISKETGLPTKWGDKENIAWKLDLPGPGGSTPCIWGERIFLTSVDGNDTVLLAVSTAGKPLWKVKLGTGMVRA